ncbi:MAG: hypothetical protein ABW007_11670 [Chitinophagaceae bacterium]
MDRRAFLTAGRTINTPIPAAPAFRTESGLNEYQGAWTRNEAQHLLKRLMFGSTRQDIDYFSSRTMQQAVDELLNPTAALPTPPLNDYTADMADPDVAAGATWINNPTIDNELNEFRQESFKK